MWLKLVLLWMLAAGGPIEQVELFDTDKEKVVQTVDSTEAIQKEAQAILQSVSGRVMEFSPDLKHALIVKIPLAPPQTLQVKSASIDAVIERLFVVMPKKGRSPWLILHSKEGDSYVVEFAQKTENLMNLLSRKQ